jgi:malonyl-CoA O-methyltransferase
LAQVHQLDKRLVRDRFRKCFRQAGNAGIIQPRMAERLVDLLLRYCPERSYGNVLEIGCGTASLAPELLKHVSIDNWVANDIVPLAEDLYKAVGKLPLKHYSFLHGDMEHVDFPGEQDLIVSNAAIQWATSFADLFEHLVQKLSRGGVLAFSTFGPENLREVSELTGLSLNYVESSTYASLMPDRGEILCVEDEPAVVEFDSAVDVLRHLKQTGVNSLARRAWTPGDLRSFSEEYHARFTVPSGSSCKTDVPVHTGQVRTPVLQGKETEECGSGTTRGAGVSLTYHPVYVVFRRHGLEGS